jgi:hypothetical protein
VRFADRQYHDLRWASREGLDHRRPTLIRDAGAGTFVDVFEYTGDPEDPVGDQISKDVIGLHGPHPIPLSDDGFCAVGEPYLLDP